MKFHTEADLVPRFKDDILPGLIEAEETRIAAAAGAHSRPSSEPRHNYADRSEWRPRDPADPWSELVPRPARRAA